MIYEQTFHCLRGHQPPWFHSRGEPQCLCEALEEITVFGEREPSESEGIGESSSDRGILERESQSEAKGEVRWELSSSDRAWRLFSPKLNWLRQIMGDEKKFCGPIYLLGVEINLRGPIVRFWASKILLRGPLVRLWASKIIFRRPCPFLFFIFLFFVRLWASKIRFRGPNNICYTLGVENKISWPILRDFGRRK